MLCIVYSFLSSTRRLGGHIPHTLGPQNKSKTQTTQSLTPPFHPCRVCHTTLSQQIWLSNNAFTWSRACIPFRQLPHPPHLPRNCMLSGEAWHTFQPRSTNSKVSHLLISYFHSADHCLAQLVALFEHPLRSLVSTSNNITGLAA
jgi:hypothetical protein